MAVVVHNIHGRRYAYDHHRVGNKVVCTYIAPADDIRTQSYITQKGYPMSDKNWKEAHTEANKEEKKEYGEEAFEKLQEKADKLFDEGQLAGSNTPEGELIAHKSLNKDEQGQVLYHEAKESEILRDEEIKQPPVQLTQKECLEKKDSTQHLDGGHWHDKGDEEGLHDHPQYEHTEAKGGYLGYKTGKDKIKRAMRHKDVPGADASRLRRF